MSALISQIIMCVKIIISSLKRKRALNEKGNGGQTFMLHRLCNAPFLFAPSSLTDACVAVECHTSYAPSLCVSFLLTGQGELHRQDDGSGGEPARPQPALHTWTHAQVKLEGGKEGANCISCCFIHQVPTAGRHMCCRLRAAHHLHGLSKCVGLM